MTRKRLTSFKPRVFAANFSGTNGLKNTFDRYVRVGFRGLMAYADVYLVCSSSFHSQQPNAIFFSFFFFPFLSLLLSFFFSFFPFFLFHPLFHTVGSCPSLRAIKVSIWWSREKSRESSTLLRGAEKKGLEAAACARVLSRLASLAKKPGFHMIAAIAEKIVQ